MGILYFLLAVKGIVSWYSNWLHQSIMRGINDTAKSKCSIFRQDRKLFQKIRLFKRGVTRTFIQLFLLPFIYFSLYLHNLKNEFFSIVIGQSKWSCSIRFLYFSSVKILCKVSNSEWICIGSVFSWAWITVCEELCQVNPLFHVIGLSKVIYTVYTEIPFLRESKNTQLDSVKETPCFPWIWFCEGI